MSNSRWSGTSIIPSDGLKNDFSPPPPACHLFHENKIALRPTARLPRLCRPGHLFLVSLARRPHHPHLALKHHYAEARKHPEKRAVLYAKLKKRMDLGDTKTLGKTLKAAGASLSRVGEGPSPEQPADLMADKGYHSRAVPKDLDGGLWKSRVAEPKCRGLNWWRGDHEARRAVYNNRIRLGTGKGREAARRRTGLAERSSFSSAPAWETVGYGWSWRSMKTGQTNGRLSLSSAHGPVESRRSQRPVKASVTKPMPAKKSKNG